MCARPSNNGAEREATRSRCSEVCFKRTTQSGREEWTKQDCPQQTGRQARADRRPAVPAAITAAAGSAAGGRDAARACMRRARPMPGCGISPSPPISLLVSMITTRLRHSSDSRRAISRTLVVLPTPGRPYRRAAPSAPHAPVHGPRDIRCARRSREPAACRLFLAKAPPAHAGLKGKGRQKASSAPLLAAGRASSLPPPPAGPRAAWGGARTSSSSERPAATRSAASAALPQTARPARQVRPMTRPSRLRRQEMRCSVRSMPARLSPPNAPSCGASSAPLHASQGRRAGNSSLAVHATAASCLPCSRRAGSTYFMT